jgi:hypothetical protein
LAKRGTPIILLRHVIGGQLHDLVKQVHLDALDGKLTTVEVDRESAGS